METGGTIRVLSEQVANKIAAGEVVERPASVAKELIENAIDSGATQIDVEVTAGGRKLVAVRDDGTGMDGDNALLSVERHATSKIRDVDDIENISTLGFRGEALAAIAAVSRFRMATGTKGQTPGTEMLIVGGKLQDVREIGVPAGTSVEVRDLFFNVPARRKFLRSHQTELSHLRDGFILEALSHPEIGMSFTVDGHETYRLASGARFHDRLHELFGPDYVKQLCGVKGRSAEVAVSGYTSLPALNRADRNEQYVFVNRRPTTAGVIAYAVREAYRTLLPKDRHPSLFLFITMDPGLVDVNVHPTKKEVRFRHPGEVRDSVIEAIQQALRRSAPGVGEAAAPLTSTSDLRDAGGSRVQAADTRLHIDDLPPTRTFQYPRLSATADEGRRPGDQAQAETDGPAPRTGTPPPAEGADKIGEAPWSWCRVLGQVGSLYVVLETEDGLVLMDPHAAHERVLFEAFMSAVLAENAGSQSLLMPETVELRPKDAVRVRDNLELLKSMGFGISEFGGDAFVVDALPACLSATSAPGVLIAVSQALEQAGARGGKGRWKEEAIAQAACKAAVKARDALKLEEIERLVVDLAQAEMPYTCPHGRPTLIFMSFRDLNKKFGRE